MSWNDHEEVKWRHEPPKAKPPPSGDTTGASSLHALARAYTDAAGRAYSRGEDKVAAALRDASTELQALAARLPPIPSETLTR